MKPTLAQEPTHAQELQQELHSRLAMHCKYSETVIPAMLELHPHAAREFRLFWPVPVAQGALAQALQGYVLRAPPMEQPRVSKTECRSLA